ncbi:unnamed protein product [Menidia menidia]|uniref:(Atlantic silverside) hypothetical protein n=1 Tax=Menidia menidia TaxID=238744 RepID=A0A8S4BL72_9TELE|nr:unnamed protein product [Menidia menidia]
MPIAELLGVQSDMQLLLKLSFSVAAVLLVSLAYRFYNSRNVRGIQPCGKNKDPQKATCQNCKTTLRHQTSPEIGKDYEGKQPVHLGEGSATGDQLHDSIKEIQAEAPPNLVEKSEGECSDQDKCLEVEILSHWNNPLDSPENISLENVLSPQDPTKYGTTTTTGRRSPCILKKLDGCVGVGRELRQDLEHQGVYSSFLSKAEIKMEALGVMSDNYLQVLRDPNLYGRLMAGEREKIQKQRMRGRKFVVVADMDPQDWLRSAQTQRPTEHRGTSSAMYYYDDYKDAWHTLCMIPQEVISKACAVCTMDNYLFVAVGCQGTDREMKPSKQVFCYNPLTSIWKEICPMNEARPRCKLAALEGYIYAIGGECLSSVERYDPRLDRWTFVAPLPNDTFAVAHHVTVCCGELFVCGGTLRCMLVRYNPKTNSWRPSLIVGSNDRTADMVAVGRFLYRFDVNPLFGVSVYRYHTVARLWYECSSKRLLRCPTFQCVTMDGAIYCISRQFTIRFEADEISPSFSDEDLSVLSAAKGILFPFVLSLPDKKPLQTSV